MNAAITVRLDRVILCSDARHGSSPPSVSAYRILKDFCVRPGSKNRTYDRVRIMRCLTSGTEVYWQYGRRKGWLKAWRIAIVGDPKHGLLREEMEGILERCKDYKFVVVEIALDFSPTTQVDRVFVKRHALFGKSLRRWDRGGPQQLRYGTRRSGKLVRCYRKKEVNAYRVELELHSVLLRRGQITQLHDLPRVAAVIAPRHVRFVQLAYADIRRRLCTRFGNKAQDMLQEVKRRSNTSIHFATRYLRGKGLKNLHRLCRMLSVNRAVDNALREWARNF